MIADRQPGNLAPAERAVAVEVRQENHRVRLGDREQQRIGRVDVVIVIEVKDELVAGGEQDRRRGADRDLRGRLRAWILRRRAGRVRHGEAGGRDEKNGRSDAGFEDFDGGSFHGRWIFRRIMRRANPAVEPRLSGSSSSPARLVSRTFEDEDTTNNEDVFDNLCRVRLIRAPSGDGASLREALPIRS